MRTIRCSSSHCSAASCDIPASGLSPRTYALNASSTSASARHGGGRMRGQCRPQRLGLPGGLADRQGVQRVADRRVRQRTAHGGRLGVGQQVYPADAGDGGHRGAHVATAHGLSDRRPAHLLSGRRRRGQAHRPTRRCERNPRRPRRPVDRHGANRAAALPAPPRRPAVRSTDRRPCHTSRNRPRSASAHHVQADRPHAPRTAHCGAAPMLLPARRTNAGTRRCNTDSVPSSLTITTITASGAAAAATSAR